MQRANPITLYIPLACVTLLGLSCGRSAQPKAEALEQLEAGKKHIQAEAWLSSLKCLDAAITLDPALDEAYLLRATAINEYIQDSLSKRQMPSGYSREDALRDLERYAQLHPDSGEAYLQQGYALAGLARVADAKRAFTKAIQRLIDPTKALIERAALCFHEGEYKNAVDDMTKVIDKNPFEPDFHETLSMYHRFNGDLREARCDQAKAARLRKDNKNVTLEELKALEQVEGDDDERVTKLQDTPEIEAEANRLRGKWKLISIETVGALTDTSERNSDVTFAENGYTLTIDGVAQQRGKYLLDPSVKPCRIDLMGKVGDREATFLAIYEIERVNLRLCLSRPGEPRPSQLAIAGRVERSLYVLKRTDVHKD
jgi:uncharacterized protein (TIGR03067 family)